VSKKKKSKAAAAEGKDAPGRDLATNRQARFKYHLLDRWEAGMVLQGSEVKSLRNGQVTLKDSFASVRDGEVWLHSMYIAPYGSAAGDQHEPERQRKLLLYRREIERLIGKSKETGLTLIPTRIYFSGSTAKIEIALAKGKDQRDKRDSIKEREQKREMDRAMKERR